MLYCVIYLYCYLVWVHVTSGAALISNIYVHTWDKNKLFTDYFFDTHTTVERDRGDMRKKKWRDIAAQRRSAIPPPHTVSRNRKNATNHGSQHGGKRGRARTRWRLVKSSRRKTTAIDLCEWARARVYQIPRAHASCLDTIIIEIANNGCFTREIRIQFDTTLKTATRPSGVPITTTRSFSQLRSRIEITRHIFADPPVAAIVGHIIAHLWFFANSRYAHFTD